MPDEQRPESDELPQWIDMDKLDYRRGAIMGRRTKPERVPDEQREQEHRRKSLKNWTMGDWQDEAKAQRTRAESAERELRTTADALLVAAEERGTAEHRASLLAARVEELERDNSSLRLRCDALEHVDRKNNEYLIGERDATQARLERCQEALREIEATTAAGRATDRYAARAYKSARSALHPATEKDSNGPT